MRIKLILLILWLAAFFSSNAQQVTNSGFETWSNTKNPDGWITYSSVTPFIDLAGKDITDKIEGTASAKIQTTFILGSTIYEILSLGAVKINWFGPGPQYTFFPVFFPFRPDTLFFAYKYSSPGIDTASVRIKLSSANNSLIDKVIPLNKSSEWTFSSMLLTPLYKNLNTPDSLLIQFKSSMANGKYFGTPGSVLNIDAIRFGYDIVHTGIEELRNDIKVSVFPNPSSQSVNIQTNKPQNSASIIVYDLTGREMIHELIVGKKHQIQVDKWRNGIYTYVIISKNKAILNGRFIVNK
jgi:hypothetical protein